MSSIVVAGDVSGSVTLSAPSAAGSVTVTLPASSGTMLTTATPFSNGQGPAFSATRAGSQSVTTSTWTKVQLDSEDFDTANCFDSTTNYRFTPNVAGYYQVNCFAPTTGSAYCSANYGALYKNGSIYKREFGSSYSSAIVNANLASGSYLVYLNGTTDYIEMYAYVTCATSPVVMANTTFSASLVRAA